jgi:cyclophilin family peptidyl-prolyl cis-trans isomerase
MVVSSFRSFFFLASLLLASSSFVHAQDGEDRPRVQIETSLGSMVIELYNETPIHRDNFLKLAGEGFYDGLLWHRVIAGFMTQGGDPKSKGAAPGTRLGSGGPGYTLESEIDPAFNHVKGALSAARQGDQVNPQRRSSGSQFYIVQGRDVSAQALQQIVNSKRNSVLQAFSYTADQIAEYGELGGTPHLDMQYTVFGRVVEGLDVLDAICAVPTDRSDRPAEDIEMSMKILD